MVGRKGQLRSSAGRGQYCSLKAAFQTVREGGKVGESAFGIAVEGGQTQIGEITVFGTAREGGRIQAWKLQFHCSCLTMAVLEKTWLPVERAALTC